MGEDMGKNMFKVQKNQLLIQIKKNSFQAVSSIAELDIPGHLLLLLLLVCAFSRDGISIENMVNEMPQWFNSILPKPIVMNYHI